MRSLVRSLRESEGHAGQIGWSGRAAKQQPRDRDAMNDGERRHDGGPNPIRSARTTAIAPIA